MEQYIYYKDDLTNPSLGGHLPVSTLADYNNFQTEFTNAVKQKYNEGFNYNPELLGPSAILNTVTGSEFRIPDQNSGGYAMVSPTGGFSVQGDNFGVTMRPGEFGGSYKTNDGKTFINASVNTLGNNDFGANVGFSYNPADPISNNIQIDGTQMGLANENLVNSTDLDERSEGEKYLEDLLERDYGITPFGGVGASL